MGQGKPVGTMFVELSLDATKYTKGQKEILAGAEKNSADINKTMKTVGITSDKMYDAMRQNIQNSLDAINRSHLTSAAERTRAEQSAAEKIKRINEQQFGHQTTLIEGLKKNWIAAAAVITTAMIAASKAWDLAKIGAEYAEQQGILNNLSAKYKTTANDIVVAMQKASDGTVSNSDLMKIALGGISKGLNPEQLTELSSAAKMLADVTGETTTQALTTLSEALETGRMKALKHYAGTIDLKDAFGELTDKLTATEKAQAMYALIIQHTTELQAQQTKAVDESADKIERMEASYNNAKLAAGNFFKTVVAGIYDMVTALASVPVDYDMSGMGAQPLSVPRQSNKSAKTVGGASGDLASGDLASLNIELLKRNVAEREKATKATEDAAKAIESATKQALEATRKATYEIDSVGLSQYQKDLDRIKAEADKYRKAGVDKVTVAKYVAAETELALRKSFVVQTEENKKMYEEMQKGAEEYRKMVSAEQSFSVSKHEKAMLEIIANEDNKLRAAEKLMDEGKISWDEYQAYLLLVQQNAAIATQELIQKELSDYADFYSQITGHEEEYRDNKLKWIDKEQKRLAELYKDDVAAAKWAADQKGKLEYDLFKKKTDYIADGFGNLSSAFDGISELYAEGSKDAEKWEEAAKTMEIAQRAVAVVQAVAAIATQGLGDPYTAFARVAAMAATMGALLASIGESVSGSSASVAAASQRTSSTALGSEEASTSISNSLEILQDTYDIENTRLTQIYQEMRDLNNNITGLVTNIIRNGGVLSASDIGITVGTTINADMLGFGGGGYNTGVGMLDNVLNYVQSNIFGGDTTVKLKESGISFGKTLVSNLLAGADVAARQYAKVKITEEGGWFGSDSTKTKYYYDSLDASVTRMITLVYENISSGLVYMAEQLGGDVADVYAYVFDASKLNLKKMTTDEMNTALNEYFSTISDVAVESLFGDLISQYQELNEGLYETAIRLISDKATIEKILELTNQTFSGTTSEFIEFSESLITVAGSLDDLTDAFSTYYDAFFTDAEKQADYKKQLSGVMSSYGYSLPTSRTGYRDIVESLDLTTDAGMSAYYALLAVSETADKYYDYLENAASSVSESQYATKVEYLRAVRGYASGTDNAYGLAVVGEDGPELVNFNTSARVYSNKDSKSLLSTSEVVAEIKSLREDLQAQNGSIATYNYKMVKCLQFLEQWDAGGMPAERAA